MKPLRSAPFIALAALVCPSFCPAAARADNPVDKEIAELGRKVEKLAGKPEASVPLLELFGRWDESTPDKTLAVMERIAANKRLSAQTHVLAQSLLADAHTRLGKPESQERSEQLGFITRFRVVGPFDNEGKAGFDTEVPPEAQRMLAPDLQASFPGRERPVRWRELPDITQRGYVSFAAVMRPRENVCALAETFVHSDKAQPLTLWIGSGGANKVYWNGSEVLRDAGYRSASPDRSVAVVAARKGSNRVLAKVCVATGSWGFYLRVGDARGMPLSGLKVETNAQDALDIATTLPKLKLPKPPATALAVLEAAATKDKPTAAALFELARYMRYTGADDPAERRAKQLAARAVELDPALPHVLLASELSEQRAERLKFAQQAEKAFPDEPRSLLLRARLTAGGPVPEDALPLLAKIGKGTPSWALARQLHASIVRELELASYALRIVEEAAAEIGRTPQLLRQLADLYNASGATDRSLATRKELLTLRFDDGGNRRVLVTDALSRRNKAEVLEHLDAQARLSRSTAESALYLAEIYDALGRDDLVLAAYRDALEVVPEAAELHVAYAKALLRADQQEPAAEALGRALALRPQDAASRELLEQLQPRVRPDEAYALPSEKLLAMRRPAAGYPSTVLTDLTVNTVFDNGLGSSFRQFAVQVHDDEGARRYRTFPIQYDPDSQRVELRLSRVYRKDGRVLESVRSYEQQLGEPWYRIYYDTRALVIVLPDLEQGDVVEVRYRVDDVAHRNLFADYYGDLHTLQSYVPTARVEYVLITPASRRFYVKEPKMAGLTHEQKVQGSQRIDRWVAQNVPAIVVESDMPGMTEVSPYLHVSTYDSWQSVGKWYWGLIKDQLYADASLSKTVRDLVAGATTTKQKVERIHRWVVTNTRYVGLEFGIHGYLPYRVPLIVQRGFGDCKDKASLLYTMMREAGVEARIVLLRTRRNGGIATEPASLAVFDHAIAYVPELDLYLDGTAEHSGTSELPAQDQGVQVLVVGPNSAELRTTPVFEADKNRRSRKLEVALAADGSADVAGSEVVAGAEAAGYRGYYEAAGTRAERFERSLGTLYPGVKLKEQTFAPLDDREHPVKYSYRIDVPQLARWDGDELRLEPTVLRDLVQSMARQPSRKHALDLQGARAYDEERLVKLPAGFVVRDLPSGGEVSSRFGRLRLELTRGAGTVTARTEFLVQADRVSPSEYPEFRRWVEAADQLLKQRIGLQKEQAR